MPKRAELIRKDISPIAERDLMALILVVREDNTWQVIKSHDYADYHMVLAFGEVVPEEAAKILYPKIAAKGLTYKNE